MYTEVIKALQVADSTLTEMAVHGDSIAPAHVRNYIKTTLEMAKQAQTTSESKKHYIDNVGDTSKVKVPDDLTMKFCELVLDPILEAGGDIRENLRTAIKELDWEVHTIMYDYSLAESLNGIGGSPTTKTLYQDEPEKRIIVDIYEDWISSGYLKEEFYLYWHDFLMDCWIGCYTFND